MKHLFYMVMGVVAATLLLAIAIFFGCLRLLLSFAFGNTFALVVVTLCVLYFIGRILSDYLGL